MRDRRTRATSAAGLVLAAVGLVLAVSGCAWWAQSNDGTATGASATPDVGTTAKPALAARRPGAPTLVRIPALHVKAPVLPVHAPGRTLVPPQDPRRLGWWADGAEPGAGRGSALIAGHTVHTGGGALDDLERLRRGDRVVVRTDHGAIAYQVDRVRIYAKGRLADEATRLFSQKVPGRLVLITCEDWDGSRYLSNVVVTATPRS